MNFKVFGIISDSETGEPLEYATISIKSKNNPEKIFGGLTDENGKGFGKRLGSLSIEKLRETGFESLTILNYLLSENEIFNISGTISYLEIPLD